MRFIAEQDGEPISARAIRGAPIGACVQTAIASAAMIEERSARSVRYRRPGSGDMTEPFLLAEPTDDRTSDAHLRAVADVYQRAGEKPTQAVADHFQPVSYSTAARWVMHARRRGFLPPATQRRKDK